MVARDAEAYIYIYMCVYAYIYIYIYMYICISSCLRQSPPPCPTEGALGTWLKDRILWSRAGLLNFKIVLAAPGRVLETTLAPTGAAEEPQARLCGDPKRFLVVGDGLPSASGDGPRSILHWKNAYKMKSQHIGKNH